jgi:hypothetical protein
MKTRIIGVLTLAVAITTLIWGVITVSSAVTAPAVTTLEEKIEAMGNLDFLFYFNYVNAAFITLLSVAMLKKQNCGQQLPLHLFLSTGWVT